MANLCLMHTHVVLESATGPTWVKGAASRPQLSASGIPYPAPMTLTSRPLAAHPAQAASKCPVPLPGQRRGWQLPRCPALPLAVRLWHSPVPRRQRLLGALWGGSGLPGWWCPGWVRGPGSRGRCAASGICAGHARGHLSMPCSCSLDSRTAGKKATNTKRTATHCCHSSWQDGGRGVQECDIRECCGSPSKPPWLEHHRQRLGPRTSLTARAAAAVTECSHICWGRGNEHDLQRKRVSTASHACLNWPGPPMRPHFRDKNGPTSALPWVSPPAS